MKTFDFTAIVIEKAGVKTRKIYKKDFIIWRTVPLFGVPSHYLAYRPMKLYKVSIFSVQCALAN